VRAAAQTDTELVMSERELDVILWGATGFTGRLVAEYLVERSGAGQLAWALAGRNLAKLEALRDDLARLDPSAAELPIVTGDSADRASLDALAARARVVCTTVGPYATYGSELVAACISQGAHYCDLTGETQWIRRMIDAHHDEAVEAGTRIVNCCGFDSIPSDLGTQLLQARAVEHDGEPCDAITLHVITAKGGASGGSIASVMNVLREAKDPEVRRILGHAYALNPEGEREGPDRGDQMGVRRDKATGAWTGPFIMAAINARIVRRSNALLGYPYGRDFRYAEVTRAGRGIGGMLRATGLAAGLGGMVGLAAFGPMRALLQKTVLPAPGQGPSREQIEGGHFEVELVGTRDGRRVGTVTVRGNRDPGYGATACMLAESALCLSLDEASLDSPGGVLTPAVAMGGRLRDRLNREGVTFQYEPA